MGVPAGGVTWNYIVPVSSPSGVALKRFPVEMNRDDKMLAVRPPHPEEGASTCASEETQSSRSARLEEDGAAPWFETPRTRMRNLGRPKIAAPHHEAERDRERIKLIEIRFSAPFPKFVIRLSML
jgi:hypothetical protein